MTNRGRFRAGEVALLRQAVRELPRGTVVRVISLDEASTDPLYLVQPLVSTAKGKSAGSRNRSGLS